MILGTSQGLAYADPYPLDYGAGATPAQIVDDFTTRAGIVNGTITTALTTFVAALKTANLWDKFIAIYPVVGGTAAAHAQNLVSSTFPITWNGTVTHDALGSRSDGTTGYGDTGIVLNSLTLNDLALSAYATYATATTGTLIGASNGSTITYQVAISNSVFYADMNSHSSGRLQTSINTPPGGLFVANRQSSTLAQAVRDAAVHNSIASAVTTGAVSGNICVLAQGGTMTNTGHHPYPVRFIAISKGIPTGSLAAYNTAVINLLTTLNRVRDVDADDYLSRAALTNGVQVGAIYNLTRDLRLASLWSKMYGLYPLVGGTAVAHAQNLFANLWNITWVNAPTHNAVGVSGNGTTMYGNSNLPASSLSGFNLHLSTYISGSAGVCDPIGLFDGADYALEMEIVPGSLTAGCIFDCNKLSEGRMAVTTDGLAQQVITRTSSSAAAGYSRGASVGTKLTTVTAITMPALNIFLLCRNNAGSTFGLMGAGATLSFASIGAGLSAADVLAFHTIVQQYQTTLGRNDTDAANFAGRAGLTDPTQMTAVSTLVTALKAANLWTKFIALYPIVGGTAASHSQNLKSSLYPITWINAPTHNANGVTGNGTTMSGTCVGLTTGIVGHLCHLGAYVRTATPNTSYENYIGMSPGGSQYYCIQRTSAAGGQPYTYEGYAGHIGSSAAVVEGTTARLGLLTIERSANNVFGLYHAGNLIASNATVTAPIASLGDFAVMARNDAGATNSWVLNTVAFFSVGASLTPAEGVTFNTIIQQFQTTLGRNV